MLLRPLDIIFDMRTDLGRPNMMKLNFGSKKIRDAVHALIVSNLFFWYWRVVGNGDV